MRILLVEDDTILGDGLSASLRLEGHRVEWLTFGEDAVHATAADTFDVAILDLALPDLSGQDVLKRWRQSGTHMPVLVLTAFEKDEACVAALNAGADDYLVKPVPLDELLARLRALQRRAAGQSGNHLVRGPLLLDRAARAAFLDGAALVLSHYEYEVLEALAEHRDRPVRRETLESRLYGWESGPESNSLEVLIHKLRGKVGRTRIVTVRGIGYRLNP